jgi:MOSC domain-containing protein YiiM
MLGKVGADGSVEHVVIGRVVAVNVGEPRDVDWHGRVVRTAIWKAPVPGPVALRGVNLVGDAQADRRVHGGVDKAVYAYAVEDYAWWAEELGQDLEPGTFGENLTITGIALGSAVVGERWRVGTAVLEVAQPRLPCFKLGIRMGDASFVDRFDRARRTGTYLRIVTEGVVEAGDPIEVQRRPDHGLTVDDITATHVDPSPEALERLLDVVDVPEGWQTWALRQQSRRR